MPWTDPQPASPNKDPYLGADMSLSRRMGALLWSFGLALAVVLLPLSPPNKAIGDAGWIFAAAFIVFALTYIWSLLSPRVNWTYPRLLAAAFAGVLMIAAMQWLAGGVEAPYASLLLLAVLFVAAVHPASRIAPFMVVIALVLGSPFVYDHWDRNAVATWLAAFVVWCALAVVAHLVMRGVRFQRVALQEGQTQARVEARLDGLTGIGNRRAFEEALEDEVARVGRLGSPLSVAMVDIERFKSVNDEFGHLVGDECLRDLAAAVTGELRAPDRCYRWGGDEFALILPGTRGSGAERLGDRLRSFVAVSCKRPDGDPLQVRYGAAQLERGMTAEDLLSRADLSLNGARASR